MTSKKGYTVTLDGQALGTWVLKHRATKCARFISEAFIVKGVQDYEIEVSGEGFMETTVANNGVLVKRKGASKMTLEQMIEEDTTIDEFTEACMMQGMTEDEALARWEEIFKGVTA